jgi:hypothetical protein
MTEIALRLAFRDEGRWWTCYIAKRDTMADAINVGRIPRAAAEHPEMREGFMALMKLMLELHANRRVEQWDPPTSAPEHEKGGRA